MLLILMYHQVVSSRKLSEISITENIINKFEKHLIYLQKNFNIIVPGQAILKNKISVCLTFDDAYADFYQYVFPLLQKLHIPAVLAIPAGLIENDNSKNNSSYNYSNNYSSVLDANLCTWEQIRTMVSSQLVYPASHSFTHKNLQQINQDEAYQEICISKRAIATNLEKIPEIFIYPFGAYNKRVHQMAKAHYKYVMRIGGASNCRWRQSVLYRVNADDFWQNGKEISMVNLLGWTIKYYLNQIRFR